MRKLSEYTERAEHELQMLFDDRAARELFIDSLKDDYATTVFEDETDGEILTLAAALGRRLAPEMAPRGDAIQILQQEPGLAVTILDALVPGGVFDDGVATKLHHDLSERVKQKILAALRGAGSFALDPKAAAATIGTRGRRTRRRSAQSAVEDVVDRACDELLDICADPQRSAELQEKVNSYRTRFGRMTEKSFIATLLMDKVLPSPFPRSLALEMLAGDDSLCQEELCHHDLQDRILGAVDQAVLERSRPLLEQFNKLFAEELLSPADRQTLIANRLGATMTL